MSVIRPAKMQDFDAIMEIAVEQCTRYDKMRVDTDKLKDTIRTGISAKAHFANVAIDNGQVVGVLIGMTINNAWAQKKNCAIVLWVSKVAPLGSHLLRSFKVWLKPRRGIRLAGLFRDIDGDERAWQLAEKLGFEKTGGGYYLYN